MKCAGYSSLVLFIYSIFHRSLEKTKASFRRIQSIWGQLLLIKWRKNNSDWWKIIFKLKKWKCDLVNFLAPFWYFDTLLPRYLQRKILLKCHILEDFFFILVNCKNWGNKCVCGFWQKNHCKKRLLLMIWSSSSTQFYMQLV